MHKLLFCAALAAVFTIAGAHGYERRPQKPAIVLAAFGTTDVEAVHAIMNVLARVKAAFPEYDVHLALTSNIIRNRWRQRAADADFRRENPDIPEEFYTAGNVLTTLANIQEKGARLILVQSLHVTDGEEYTDMANLVKTLENYKTMKPALHPFPWIGVGAPVLGVGDGPERNLERAATALEPLAREARESAAALVLMGHGNEHLKQEVFARLQAVMRRKYGPRVYIGSVEAPPFAEDIAAEIKASADAPKAVLLAPLMLVAGDHAKNDMAGDEDDSWQSVFAAEGFQVKSHLEGLGLNNSWADIYVEHLRELESAVVAKKNADVEEADD